MSPRSWGVSLSQHVGVFTNLKARIPNLQRYGTLPHTHPQSWAKVTLSFPPHVGLAFHLQQAAIPTALLLVSQSS